ncbi:MAG: SsrA-binding protein SmpB [Acidimicrobiia bacterium]|nr:SsrA-binding protein SmpB [Acidimicrobiia bacterium]
MKVVTTNRRARYDHEILETFEAGIVLVGSEVKSLRDGQVNLKDSYVTVRGGELWLVGCHIAPYAFSRLGGHEPERDRKLLLHRREIDRVSAKLAEKGLTLIPLRIYFKEGKAKAELGLGRGKRAYDKRQSLKAKEQKREMDRALRHRGRQ